MTHHARRTSIKSSYSLICSWFGPCLARIGEIRCTAAMQLYLCHHRSVSSSIRVARLGNFHGKSRGGKTLMISPNIHRVLVDTDREGVPGWWTYGFMSSTPQSARGVPQKTKKCGQKNEEMWTKKHCVLELYSWKKTFHRTRIFRKTLVRTSTAHRWRSSKKKLLATVRARTNPTTWNHIFKLERQKSRCLEDTKTAVAFATLQ